MSQQVLAQGARGGGLTLIGSSASLAIQFASVAVLSRLLSPDDFGLVAMVTVFIALGNLIRDFGMPMAALQAKELSYQQASNLFWMNLALAGASAAMLGLATPLLVTLYSEPRLAAIVPAMAVVILISGTTAQLQVDLARNLRFRALVVSDIVAQLSALCVAAALAYSGAGYWALVAQSLVGAVVTLVLRWAASRWLPMRPRRGHDSARLFRAGAEYGFAHFLTFLQSNADTLIIGSSLGASALGFYNRGYQLLTAPAGRLLDPLTQVVVPTLNRARAEGRAYEPLLLRIQFAVGSGIVWLFSMAASTAVNLVPLALGPGWERTIPVFQILAIGGCVAVFSHVSYWVFILNEQSRQLLHYNLVSKPISVICIAVGAPFGIEGVAWGYVAGMVISWPLNLIWLARTAKLPSWAFAGNGAKVLLAGATGALVAWTLTSTAWGLGTIPEALLGVLAGTAAMLAVLLMFPGSRRHLVGSVELVKLILNGKE